jgi:predicted TIM-barrel fold metal-dependent hydrolase
MGSILPTSLTLRQMGRVEARTAVAGTADETAFPIAPATFDTMLGVPSNRAAWQKDFGTLVRDKASGTLAHPAGYMFKDLPTVDDEGDYGDWLIAQMDAWGVEGGLLPVRFDDDDLGTAAVRAHPQRLYGSYHVDPNRGIDDVRALKRAVRELGAVAASCFPCGTQPQVDINAPLMYPLYAACVELGIPMFVNAGVPGPRFPMQPQHVEHLDEVCYDFPELVLVTRHGGEPWQALLVKLMLKWPGLHYSTSAFAPKHFPREIVDYANTRGGDKVMYAGYFPMGLTLERSFTELPTVPFRADVWPRFLHANARRILGLSTET